MPQLQVAAEIRERLQGHARSLSFAVSGFSLQALTIGACPTLTTWTRTRQTPAGGRGLHPPPAGSAPGGRCCALGPARITCEVVWDSGKFGSRDSINEPKQQR